MMRLRKACILAGVVLLFPLAANAESDFDGDGVPDTVDNCTLLGNAGQEDLDGDGFGNRCDADFNNDCIVSIIDWGVFQPCLTARGTKPTEGCEITDLNSDGRINALDLHIFEDLFGLPPGPNAGGTCNL